MKVSVRTTFVILFLLTIAGPVVAHIVNSEVAQLYDRSLTNVMAAVLYKAPVYALVTFIVLLPVCRVLGATSLEYIRQELNRDNNAAWAIILVGTTAIVVFLLAAIWGG